MPEPLGTPQEGVLTPQNEKRWEYDAVEVGQAGTPVTIEITTDAISAYAARMRNPNPAYQTPADVNDGDPEILAMPTMIFAAAPLRRYDIASNNGFVALERVREKPRQTPFAKCEIRWFAPIRAGDRIVSLGRVIDKYERRGNKFVTFRVEATNQHGGRVAEYDYTSIFEYAKGQNKPGDRDG